MQAVRQVRALFHGGNSAVEKLTHNSSAGEREIDILEKAVSVAQHHDGVSGTSKQHVAYDYAKKIQAGINAASEYMASTLKDVVTASINMGAMNQAIMGDIQYCQKRNESLCEISQVSVHVQWSKEIDFIFF